MAVELIVILLLTLLNGVFAGAEIAILSVRKTRLNELVENRVWGAGAVFWLRSKPERFLATVQIGITVVSTTAAAFGGESLGADLTRRLADLPIVAPYAHTLGFLIVVVGISFTGIVLGELVPKSLALRSAERYALFIAPFLRGVATLAKPAVWVLSGASNLVLKVFKDKTSFTEARLSPDELQELVEEAARSGSIDMKTGEIASRALDFRELDAASVMVPRTRIVALSADATAPEVLETYSKHRYARMPVYEGSLENIIGYLTIRDLVEPALTGAPLSVRKLIRPARFAAEKAPAAHVLRTMQSERVPMMIVVNEHGGVQGLITIEDLMEELVGDILSEHETAAFEVTKEPDGSTLYPGTMPIREANRALRIDLPEPEEYTTLAGLCIHFAGKIPHPGTVLKMPDGSIVEVVDASPRNVRKVRIRKRQSQK